MSSKNSGHSSRLGAQNIASWFAARGLRTEKSDPDSLFQLRGKVAHVL